MRAQASVVVIADAIFDVTTLAEVVKAGQKFNMDMDIRRADDRQAGEAVLMKSREPDFLINVLARLTYLETQSQDSTAEQVLERVKQRLTQLHVPLDSKPSDRRGIGEGHVEGQ